MLTVSELIERHKSETCHDPRDRRCGFCQLAFEIEYLKAEQKKASDMFAQFCRFNLRMSAVAEDLNNFLLSDACEFVGRELAKGNKSS